MFVALTFDVEFPDQPEHVDPDEVGAILDALGSSDMRATFFVQGRWAEANPGPARAIGTAGHLVGNHSYFHTDTRLLTAEGVRRDVERAQRAIEVHVGADARPWYRLPYGSGAEYARIRRRLGALGYRHVGWDVDVRDYALADSAELVPALAAALEERRRAGATHAIVLLHSWPLATAKAMPDVCRLLAGDGHRAVTVDEVPGSGAVRSRSRLAGRLSSVTASLRRHQG